MFGLFGLGFFLTQGFVFFVALGVGFEDFGLPVWGFGGVKCGDLNLGFESGSLSPKQ